MVIPPESQGAATLLSWVKFFMERGTSFRSRSGKPMRSHDNRMASFHWLSKGTADAFRRSFLTTAPALARRIVRAKARIRDERI